MKEKMFKIMNAIHKYNSDKMAFQAFGLSDEIEYDALVVAPSYTPYKLLKDTAYRITTLKEGAYVAGYLVEKDSLKIAWIKTASGAGNCIDHIAVCAELRFKKMIFIGAVGALKKKFDLGDICTPLYSISGGYTNTYLKDSIKDFEPFEKVIPETVFIDRVIKEQAAKGREIKKASVFCTDSIALEYLHLDEINEFRTDLIEMETASFYLMADLLEIPSIALLVVSDNSATGAALVGRTPGEEEKYDMARKEILPKIIFDISTMS